MDAVSSAGMRQRRTFSAARRDESGETLALLVVWPALLTAILLMLVHAFIVTNARAEAELAASQGLRSAWRVAAESDFLTDRTDPGQPQFPTCFNEPHPRGPGHGRSGQGRGGPARPPPRGLALVEPRRSRAAQRLVPSPTRLPDPNLVPGQHRPTGDQTGWVRVVVSGEVFGPLAALWPNRWDQVYASAQGPAILVAPDRANRGIVVPAQLPAC